MRPCQPILVYGIHPFCFVIGSVERDAEYLKAFSLEPVIGSYYVGIFHATGTAPAGPEIYQHIAATEGRQADGIAQRIVLREFRSGMPDAGIFYRFDGLMKATPASDSRLAADSLSKTGPTTFGSMSPPTLLCKANKAMGDAGLFLA